MACRYNLLDFSMPVKNTANFLCKVDLGRGAHAGKVDVWLF
jgi:hypothetical protein